MSKERKNEAGKTLCWWTLNGKGTASQRESESALAACLPEFWLGAAGRLPDLPTGVRKGATFAAIPGALIAAAIAAKCDLSLLIPICLIVRLKKHRSSLDISRAMLARFAGVNQRTVMEHLARYVQAGILEVRSDKSGKPMRISVRAATTEQLVDMADDCSYCGEWRLPPVRKGARTVSGTRTRLLPKARAGKIRHP